MRGMPPGLATRAPSKKAALGLLAIIILAYFAGAHSNSPPKASPPAKTQSSQKSIASAFQTQTKTAPAPAPAAVAKQLNATPYYPTSLPATFHSNNDTQLIGSDTVYYSYSDSAHNQYYVTQQPTPANFSYDSFKSGLSNVEEFTVPIGKAIIGSSDSELIGGILTNKNLWILVGASSTSVQTSLKTLMNSLQPISTTP